MTAPDPTKQKRARGTLQRIFDDAANVAVVHYSCESFYDRANGASPRVTSIAVRNLDTGQTTSFSIHQTAERKGVPFEQITQNYNQLEREMLDWFFAHLSSFRSMKYLHWNMRDINYGFAAIEHRYQVLGGQPYIIPDERKFDLARLLIDIYGPGYTGHPRLETLLALNAIRPRDFLSGPEEAAAFENGNFVALHQSTLRKVDVIANVAERARNGQLKTSTSWWGMHGGRLRTFATWVAENPIITFGIGLLGLILTVLGFFLTSGTSAQVH